MAKASEQRVQELAQFIEALTERFKANESVFADRLEVSERELALLRALAKEGPMITRALGGRFGVPVSTMTGAWTSRVGTERPVSIGINTGSVSGWPIRERECGIYPVLPTTLFWISKAAGVALM